MNLGKKMFLFMLLLGSVIAVVTIGSMMRFQAARLDSQIEIAQIAIGQAASHSSQLTGAEIQALHDQVDQDIRKGAKANFLVVMSIAGFAVVIFALAASLIMWAYTSRLHAVAAAAKQIEKGEYYGWRSIRSNDEIGALSLAIDTMADAIRTRTDLLTREKNRLQDVIQSVQAGIIIIDKETRTIVDINAAAEKMLRIDREAARGRGCSEFFCDDTGLPRKVCPILDEGKPVENAERVVRNAAGEKLSVLKTVVEIELDGRRCLLENLVDLSEIKKAQEKNIRLQCQLVQSQKMEAIGMLAGGIAHDFNNILSPIIGYTSMARQQAGTNQKLLDFLDQVNIAANRAKDLVGQILAFSRKAENKKVPVELSSLVKEGLTLIRSTVPSKVEIRQDIAASARVCADPNQLHQVIMNLCTNALQAMERSGGTLTVSLKEADVSEEQGAPMGCAKGRYVVLDVSDTGSGMSRETMDRIFEPYFTTKESGRGTGLGLSVADGIVRDHAGAILVSSEPGAGSTFRVFLPQSGA